MRENHKKDYVAGKIILKNFVFRLRKKTLVRWKDDVVLWCNILTDFNVDCTPRVRNLESACSFISSRLFRVHRTFAVDEKCPKAF